MESAGSMKSSQGMMQMYKTKPFLVIFSILIFYSTNLYGANDKCISVLDVNEEIKAHFMGDSPDHKLLLDEQFEDNRNEWPDQAIRTYKGKKFKSTFKIKRGRYFIDSNKSKWELSLPVVIGSGSDYLVESCFKVDKKASFFGVVWGGDGKLATSLKRYQRFVISREGYNFSQDWFSSKSSDEWKASKLLKSGDYNTFSIVRKNFLMEVFINGQKVEEQPFRFFYGDRVGFEVGWGDVEAEVESMVVRKAPPDLPVKSAADLYGALKDGDRHEFLVSSDGLVYDLRTGLLWLQDEHEAFRRKYVIRSGWDSYDYQDVLDWLTWLNTNYWQGVTGWRLPSIAEYRSVYRKGSGIKTWPSSRLGQNLPKVHLGYLPPFNGRYDMVWSNEESGNKVWCFDFWLGGTDSQGITPKNRQRGALAVQSLHFDLKSLLGNPEDNAQPLTDADRALWQKVVKAFHANLPGPGSILFDNMLSRNAAGLYSNNIIDSIVAEKLPLELAGKLLLAISEKEKENPVFWYEYGRLSILANQPALTLLAAQRLEGTASSQPEFAEEISDYAALFRASANLLLDKEDDAYAALLMRSNWEKNLFVTNFISNEGSVLLKDKARLATMLGLEESWLTGGYKPHPPQAFYNIETGQLIEPVVKAPVIEKATTENTPDRKYETIVPKATVLD